MKPPASIISSAKESTLVKNKPTESAKQQQQQQRAGSAAEKNEDELKSLRDNSRLGDKQTEELGEPNQTNQTNEATKPAGEKQNNDAKNKLWMDFEDFFVCFK